MEENIYTKLTPATTLLDAFERQTTVAVPTSWFVLLTDVKGSTRAIEEGRYKDVNTAGGLAAMALGNELGSLEFPFVFGGDGATFLIPPEFKERAAAILLDTARKVKEFFNLELRVGIVPVSLLTERGLTLRVGKIKISPHYTQAIISGDGMEYAESLIKKDNSFLVKEGDFPAREANFNGFTCRWQDVPSPDGETVALIVAINGSEKEQQQTLQQVLKLIEQNYGPDSQHHPLKERYMKLNFRSIWREAAAQAKKKTGLLFWLHSLRIAFEMSVTALAVALRLPIKVFHYKLKNIRKYNVISADYKKYDGTLKMVIAGSAQAREKLQQGLAALKEKGKIKYGIHVSDRAILTCLLYAESAQEVHFVDAADGGYALAAKMFKSQLSN